MKAVRIESPGHIHLVEKEIPEPQPGFARVKVVCAAICATDLEVIDGNIPANYPLVPGHEWSGVVDAVGSPDDAGWIGKSVIGSNDVVCRKCPACLRGEWRYCDKFEEIGFKRDGAYAEYVNVPVYGLCVKPDSVTFAEAALAEPLGVALGSLKKAHAKFMETMVIIGAGSIGLCFLAVGKAMGMRRIVVAASSGKRLAVAEKMGAYRTVAMKEESLEEVLKNVHPGGTDLVVDATGIEECIQTSFKIARRGGKVVLAGYGRGKMMNIRVDDIHIKNLRVIGAGNNWNMHQKAIDLMEDKMVDLSPMISKKLRPEDFEEGIAMVRERPEGFVKAVFCSEDGDK